ncbi:MAG: NADH dehydrogenase [Lentisphaerae bacterium RIFOXYB12_FULL_65_16]|nr:MAG: NADH dehydrogenase [Lentisphaerae bacterium RIFOXYA12_64_32]OGV91143.1 MAG: NADH dehydrogenase [Lentisphaerae bacterium RIFOXYB12_FULL_65_16]
MLVCATGCRALGALDVSKAFRDKLASAGLSQEIDVVETGCHGLCARAPLVLIEPQDFLYGPVAPADVDEIIEVTLRGGKPVTRLCGKADGQTTAVLREEPFYRAQKRDVYRLCGRVDPKRIEDAVAYGTYETLAKVLTSRTPEQVISEVTASGLRGRGGAGFPTGRKWALCRDVAGDRKYVICNADEGDPGAFMDRALLEGVPHQILEGMLMAGYAIGATNGVVYVRAEYPIAVEHAKIAVEQARAHGLLGRNILGSKFSFEIDIRMGAGAFICGEETALIASLEGRRGMPRPRPPFPAQRGLLGCPTTINNVETLANVPLILRDGAAAFSAVGTAGSKGTKVFALAGKVRNTGLVEVPLGATLRQIVFDIGGGIPGDRPFKAAQMGGPSGGCVPAQYLDLPIDYDSVKQLGAIMGSGGLVVMDSSTCMVDIARFFTDFVHKESCGKCVPCRVGTKQMLDILVRITKGEGRMEDLEKIVSLGEMIRASSLCGLGQTAANPSLSTVRHFRDEYEAHIRDHRCPAGVCRALLKYTILADACTGCHACAKKCPVAAIVGKAKKPHEIIQAKCIKCGACREACKFDAVRLE